MYISFERNTGARQNIYFVRHLALFKYEACFVLYIYIYILAEIPGVARVSR
jgi:hypothetical protein